MSKRSLLVLSVLLALGACARPAPESSADAAAPKPLLLADADLVSASSGELRSGPVISGSLQPELRAELRAEVSGVVLAVLKDNGDPVQKGDLLVRLDPTAIRDQLLSAEEAERAARIAVDQSKRQLERLQSMSGRGLVAAEALENAEVKHNQSQSDLASARARVVQARQQLEKTEVRAPFDGIVAARTVSAGNTAQLGMQLLNVIDPATMRFAGMIAADQVGAVQAGDAVEFRVNGFPNQTFRGQVQRVNPIANEATRQVMVLVSLAESGVRLVTGLFAEGRINVRSRSAVLLPESAVQRDGDAAYVWQVQDGRLHRQTIRLGSGNAPLGQVEVQEGLAEGSGVLRHPLGSLKEGAAVELPASTAGAAPVAQVATQSAE